MKKQPKYEEGQFSFKVQLRENQNNVLNFFRSQPISILTGDPGTAKTFLSLHYALSLLKDGAIKEIIISKPLQEVGKSMGFLPGTEAEKVSVYLEPYQDNIDTLIGDSHFTRLIKEKKIRFETINFSRGKTFKNAVVIMDEAQNLSLHQLITFITRLDDSSRLIILGDELQADIKDSGLNILRTKITPGIEDIGFMELSDEYQMRNATIVALYKNYKTYLSTL